MKIEHNIQGTEIVLHIDTKNPMIHVERIEYFNHKSFLDGAAMLNYQQCYYNTDFEVQINQNEINNYSDIINPGCNYNLDVHKDLIIIQIHLEYDAEYQIDKCCSDLPCCITIAFYDACQIYAQIMNNIDQVYSECTKLEDTQFVNLVLQKKMIDTCIEAKQFNKAAKLWSKFYSTNTFTIKKGGCGCHG